MPLLRITNGLERLSDSSLLGKVNLIVSSMKDSPSFPAPKPSYFTMQEAITDFEQAINVARAGGGYDKLVKRAKRSELIRLTHNLSNYVLYVAEGDALVAKASGFSIGKQYGSSDPISKAVRLLLKDGQNRGDLTFSFSKVKAARSYIYQYTQDPLTPDSVWIQKVGTRCKIELKGLESCKRYWFRVVAVGINGQEVVSDPVSRVVQ